MPITWQLLKEEEEQAEALGKGEIRDEVSLGHYTLVSDIHCSKDEVNVYETLPAYRNKSSLLTIYQKKVLRTMMKCEERPLKVNCVNVVPQTEAECGAISVALAVKLCFSAEEEQAVLEQFVDVRGDFVESLRRNDLVEFRSRKNTDIDKKEILFSMNI